jgi:hypothetical protein
VALPVYFSFHYLNLYHDKFNIDSKTTPYFRKLMDRLKDASGMEKGQFIGYVGVGYNSKTFRCHPIEWEKTTEKSFGIPNEDVIVDAAYQFSISANEHGRIHGFFIGNIFYAVWLDPDHRLYSKRG